ncbi:prepilin-type N-terminal cleavage/methylation domain-containing protein [Rariglobus hedericola]|uniref:Prepilin-type N-terminal cleavage/methylation domain-containing protein n=2 Tax=Rariglobus hedericola TaxID=2597822 RepID=A0A556QJP2_9BACT|nr:prepilin-type N-terminal cleavage/methylation domain-containing protein [Rariglobus hedericola]
MCSDTGRPSSVMKRARTSGFTILEVLIAIAILATAAIAIGVGYVNVLNGYEVARRSTVSDPEMQFARMQLLSQPDVELARQGGEFDATDGRHVRWSAVIEPTETADLFTVTFEGEIAGTLLLKEQKTQQVFRVLRPTWSIATERATLRAASKDRILKILEGVNK